MAPKNRLLFIKEVLQLRVLVDLTQTNLMLDKISRPLSLNGRQVDSLLYAYGLGNFQTVHRTKSVSPTDFNVAATIDASNAECRRCMASFACKTADEAVGIILKRFASL